MNGPDADGWYSVTFAARPWTVNEERKWVPLQRAAKVREWREAFAWLALQARLPKRLPPVEVEIVPHGSRADLGGVLPAAKAALDGLRDAGVLIDDDERYVRRLSFLPSEPGPRALEVRLRPLQPPTP